MSWADRTTQERQEAATKLCRILAERVATFAPPGLGTWGEAWEMTASAAADYMVALSAFEVDGSPETDRRLRAAYTTLVHAWMDVADLYRERVER